MKIKFTFLAVLISVGLFAQNSLLIPSTLSGTSINLTLQNGTYQFYSGTNTTTMGANGNVLGPTLILNKGDFVNFSVNNQIGQTTTIHWHGMHVSPENDGGPHTTIAPNTTWTPSFTIMDKAGTYWYHPHLHTKTNEHVSKGIAGFIIVNDAEEAALTLPRTYGVDDFPLVVQTKDFDASKQIVVPSNSDDVIMVNATIDAALQTPAQVVRFRVLNGSSMRVFNIGLNNNKTFYQIASDGGLLSSSAALTRLQLAPGERADILIDFSGMTGQTVFLKSYASEFSNGIYGATTPGMGPGFTLTGYNPNPLNGTDFNIMQFNVTTQTASPVTSIPTTLATVTPILESTSNITRTLLMSPVDSGPNQLNGDFVINSVAFDLNVINYTIPLGNTEIWSISNNSAIAHPFHIHDVQFFILDRDGVAPAPSEQGRKDVILIKPQETIRFITKFDDFSSDVVPYMYHCHMLFHEDRGMMGQFKVVNTALGVADEVLGNKVSIYPNPTDGKIYINTQSDVTINKVEVFDMLGRSLKTIKNVKKDQAIDLQSFSMGIHFIKMYSNKGIVVKKIVVNH
ncbi:MAG: multicopper oxidase domain-containing protein [Flavobacteriaceae bacterium]|nr:multicopper oxidase domain-containing protein [Flavobacteriaceae bacterium]